MSYVLPMTFKQIPLEKWPAGLCEEAMLIALDPVAIRARLPIAFARDADDLDWFEAALLTNNSGMLCALQAYENAPSRGTNILVGKNDTRSLNLIIDMLELDTPNLLWSAPWASRAVDTALRSHRGRNMVA
jgi:hypothetical protein